jgi:hypothetical protein
MCSLFKQHKMKKGYQIGIILSCVVWQSNAQPYVDPFQVRYTYAFENKTGQATPFTHWWAGSDLPIKLKDRTYQLLSPFFESWTLDSASKDNVLPTVSSVAFPMGFILPLKNPKWSVNLMPIVRWNGEKVFGEKTFQFGGVAFMTYEKAPGKKIRFGAYMNDDFFGFFFMPLLGADWRIDSRNYIFGLLPGRLTYEHQFGKRLYGGATFRAITNSYRLQNGEYVRLDDNQISLYLDTYVSKHICLTLEPGYGIMRKLRTGINNKNYITDRNWGDGPFIKLSASWRIRL